MKTTALAAAAALALAACGGSDADTPPAGAAPGSAGTGSATGSATGGGEEVKVGMAYDVGGRGDKSFNDAAAAGLDKAKAELGAETKELEAKIGETEDQRE